RPRARSRRAPPDGLGRRPRRERRAVRSRGAGRFAGGPPPAPAPARADRHRRRHHGRRRNRRRADRPRRLGRAGHRGRDGAGTAADRGGELAAAARRLGRVRRRRGRGRRARNCARVGTRRKPAFLRRHRVSVAVETHDLFRIYGTGQGNSVALQGLSLAVRDRELMVVFGPSGSGKTTLLRILAGLDKPSAGTVHVFGTDLRKIRGRALGEYRSRMLGYVDQHYARALAPELTARELVALQLALLGEPRRSRLQRADELLERVGLAERKYARPLELSGGEQQRVALCAALAHRPKLLIADEPTGELGSENASRVYALVGELAREAGATTVIVSHDPESASIADRVVHVRDGRVS